MATNKSPIFQSTVSMLNENITTTTPATMFTAGSDGGIVNRLTATNQDASNPETLTITINDGTDDAIIGKIVVAANAGNNGTVPAVNLLDSGLMPGLLQDDGSLVLGPNCTLKVTSTATASSVAVTCQGGSYSA